MKTPLVYLPAALMLLALGCASQPADSDVGAPRKTDGVAASQPPPPVAGADDKQPSRVPATMVADSQPVNPIDGDRAMGYLRNLCAIGPRISGTPGMARQQQILEAHFRQLGAEVRRQEFEATHPRTKEPVKLTNLIMTWHPERSERILLCAHYDTRPLPDRDSDPRQRRAGTFIGANDGASGVALLMELGRLMPSLEGELGVDFVLFDAEELVYPRTPRRLLSRQHLLRRRLRRKPAETQVPVGACCSTWWATPTCNSISRRTVSVGATRVLCLRDIWSTANRLGVREFINRAGHTVRDDHLPLRNIGKIPTCNIIDFDYPYWHTTEDLPRRCSGQSLAKVGWVVYEWLRVAVRK